MPGGLSKRKVAEHFVILQNKKQRACTKNLMQTVESETVVQPANGYPMRLEKIKGIQPQ